MSVVDPHAIEKAALALAGPPRCHCPDTQSGTSAAFPERCPMHGSGEWPPARVVLQIKAALEASGYPALLAEAQEREGRAEALLEKLLMAAQIDGRFDWREVETHLRSLTRAEGLKTDPLSDGEWARYKRAMMDLDDEEAGR